MRFLCMLLYESCFQSSAYFELSLISSEKNHGCLLGRWLPSILSQIDSYSMLCLIASIIKLYSSSKVFKFKFKNESHYLKHTYYKIMSEYEYKQCLKSVNLFQDYLGVSGSEVHSCTESCHERMLSGDSSSTHTEEISDEMKEMIKQQKLIDATTKFYNDRKVQNISL